MIIWNIFFIIQFIFSDSYMRGCEVPMLVIFTTFIEGPLNEHIFSRCKSKLIVICNKEHAEKIATSIEVCSSARMIPVYGKYYYLITYDFIYIKWKWLFKKWCYFFSSNLQFDSKHGLKTKFIPKLLTKYFLYYMYTIIKAYYLILTGWLWQLSFWNSSLLRSVFVK